MSAAFSKLLPRGIDEMPDDFPSDELERRFSQDTELRHLAIRSECADKQCQQFGETLRRRITKIRQVVEANGQRQIARLRAQQRDTLQRRIKRAEEAFKRSPYVLNAIEHTRNIEARIAQRQKEIVTKLFREYWIKTKGKIKIRMPSPGAGRWGKRGRPTKEASRRFALLPKSTNGTIQAQSNGVLEGANLESDGNDKSPLPNPTNQT